MAAALFSLSPGGGSGAWVSNIAPSDPAACVRRPTPQAAHLTCVHALHVPTSRSAVCSHATERNDAAIIDDPLPATRASSGASTLSRQQWGGGRKAGGLTVDRRQLPPPPRAGRGVGLRSTADTIKPITPPCLIRLTPRNRAARHSDLAPDGRAGAPGRRKGFASLQHGRGALLPALLRWAQGKPQPCGWRGQGGTRCCSGATVTAAVV